MSLHLPAGVDSSSASRSASVASLPTSLGAIGYRPILTSPHAPAKAPHVVGAGSSKTHGMMPSWPPQAMPLPGTMMMMPFMPFPGRPGAQQPSSGHITKEELSKVYHLPQTEAAAILNTSVRKIKELCGKYKINRWPFRALQSLDKLCSIVEEEAMIEPSPESVS